MSPWLVSLSLALWAVTMAPPHLRSQSRDSGPTPSVDHHAHLKSTAVARLFHVRLPVIDLPPTLDRVLRDFERHWHARDQAALTELFTDDGIMRFGDAWRRGRSAIHIALLDSRGADLRLWAQAFEAKDSLAYIVGWYGHRTLPHLSDLGRMHLSLRLERDGVWRIAAAVLGNVNPPSPSDTATYPADVLIAQLDSAGMRRAVVMSWAYQFGAPSFDVGDEYAKVQEENDWTARQVSRALPDSMKQVLSNRIRAIGINRMLFALDLVEQGSQRRRQAWEAFILLPLETAEVKTIAASVAPYFR